MAYDDTKIAKLEYLMAVNARNVKNQQTQPVTPGSRKLVPTKEKKTNTIEPSQRKRERSQQIVIKTRKQRKELDPDMAIYENFHRNRSRSSRSSSVQKGEPD